MSEIHQSISDPLVAQLAETLLARQQTLFVIEASAGGAVQARLSAAAGASAWLLGGLNCYHDRIKTDVLGLRPKLLQQYGAVSAPSVSAMAQRGLQISGSDWVLVESGVYGPGGGSPEKPVGLVMIGVGQVRSVACQQLTLTGSRLSLREQVTTQVLQQLLTALQANDLAVDSMNLR
ncbi:MAG: CinA family protein [Oceanococcus sp.]